MKKIIVLLCAAAVSVCVASAREVGGTVKCGGEGISDVVVSDGLSTCVTDSNGSFRLEIDKDSRFVFVSTPSGYVSGTRNGVVRFFIPIASKRDTYDFELRRNELDDTNHNIIVYADPQIQEKSEFPLLKENVEDIVAEVGKMKGTYTFGICLGDIVGFDHSFYPKINDIMSKTGIQIRNVIGNHDMTNWLRSYEMSQTDYEKMYGPAYYSFNVGKIHYVVLNDNFYIGRDWYYIGYLDERQLRWLDNDLSHVPHGSSVTVCLHIPSTLSQADRDAFDYKDIVDILVNKQPLYDVLAPYKAMILSGHIHTGDNQIIGKNLMEQNIASLGGAWWCGDVCVDGAPEGYKIFNVTGNEMQWTYKGCGYDMNYQMKVYVDDGLYPGLVVANVWDYDDLWKVEYFEDGKFVCEMERFTGLDPYAVEVYNGKPMKREWVCAIDCPNLFKAPLSSDAKGLEVRVTDRFGRVYTWSSSVSE